MTGALILAVHLFWHTPLHIYKYKKKTSNRLQGPAHALFAGLDIGNVDARTVFEVFSPPVHLLPYILVK